MKRLAAEFRPSPAPGPVLWAALAASALAATVGLALAWERGQAVRGAAAELARLESARLDDATRQALPEPQRPPPDGALELLRERALPWPQALTVLETVALPGVALRTLEAGADDGQIRIELVAPDHGRVLEYLERLNAASAGALAPHLSWRLLQARQDGTTNQVVALVAAESGTAPGVRGR